VTNLSQGKIGRAAKFAAGASLAALLFAASAGSQQLAGTNAAMTAPGAMTSPAAMPPQGAQPVQAPAEQPEGGERERLHLLVGRSLVITSPTRIKRISIADPTIADAIVINPTQILLNGKAPGGVSLVVWDESDQNQTFEIFVDMDILGLSQKLREVFPNQPIRVEAQKDLVMLSGQATSKSVEDAIVKIVLAVAPKVVNLIEAPSAPTTGQILLKVRFAEIDRSVLNNFGVNLFSPGTATSGPGSTIGTAGTQQFSAPSLSSLSSSNSNSGTHTATSNLATNFNFSNLLNIFLFRSDIDLGTTIQDLQEKNILQILAEPNLMTETGKEASFLAGGEFPYPVVQSSISGNAITIQFREYGVRLTFTPTITENGQIHLRVQPEVSSLDYSNAVTISGFTIPALSTRRVQTEMDLGDGQSFVIAGLMDNQVTQTLSKVPGIGDVPVLGQLFRSRSFNRSKTELIVVVTPQVVKPVPAGQTPAGPQYPVPFLGQNGGTAANPPAAK